MLKFLTFLVVLLSALHLTACCKSTEHRKYDQTHYIERLSTTTREEVERDSDQNERYFDIASGLFYDTDYSQGGEYYNGYQWHHPENQPNTYGKDFYAQFSVEQDQFLTLFLASDHDYQDGRSSVLFIPEINFCEGPVRIRGSLSTRIYPNTSDTEIADSLHRFKAQISIPILIAKGVIQPEGSQKALCVTAKGFISQGDVCSNSVNKNWRYNEIRIEANEIESIMNDLKAQGIEYDYPENPIY